MDFTRPVNAAESPRPRGGRWWRRALVFVVAMVALLVGLVAAAPMVLSMGWARALIVGKANAALAPARVEVRDWSLAWFGEQRVEGIVYDDAARGVRAKVRAVRLGSLWSLLPVGKMRAEVAVEAPEVTLSAAASGVTPAPSAPEAPPSLPETEPRAPLVLPAWDVSAKLSVTEATVRMAGLPEPLLSQGRVEITLPSLDEAIEAAVSGMVLDAAARAEATLPPAAALVAAKHPAAFVRKATAHVAAPWATVDVVAQGGKGVWPEASLKAQADLAKALARARTLGVALPGVGAAEGTLRAEASVAPGAGEALKLTLELGTRAAAVTYEGKRMAFSPEASVALAATFDPAHPLAAQVERLSVSLPGVLASGRGTLESGTLDAQVEAAPLLAALAPFTGGFQLPEPLTLRLTARAEKEALGLEAQAKAAKAPLAELTLKAEGLDPAAASVRSAKLGVKAHLAALARLASLPAHQSLAGTFYLNAAAAGSPDDLKGSLAFALRDVAYRAASWKVEEPSLLEGEATFEGKAKPFGSFPKWVIGAPTLKVSSPVASLEGSVTYGVPLSLSATLKGEVKPGDALAKWRVWGKDETPVALAGAIAYSVLGGYSGPSKSGEAVLEVAAKDFAVTLSPHRAFPFPFSLETKATLGEALALNPFRFASPYLEVTAEGTLAEGQVRLKGDWAPNLGRAFDDLPFFDGLREHVSVNGNATRPFAFEAPVGQGVAGLLSYGKGSAEVAIDRVVVPGLDIPGGTVKATLAEGVAALDGRLAVNGGTVRLTPRVALAAKPYTLTVPDGTPLLEKVALTPELLDAALKAVNPLLPGSATPEGQIDLVCDTLTLPLGEDPLRALEAAFTLRTRDCSLQPNGTLAMVLALVKRAGERVTLDDQTFAVRVAEGKLACDDLTLRVGRLRLACAGHTDLPTRQLRYELRAPLTEELLGGRLADYVKPGQTLRLPIGGTIDKPIIDTEPLLRSLRESATDAAVGRLAEKLGKKLGKALDEEPAPAADPKQQRKEALGNLLNDVLKRRKK